MLILLRGHRPFVALPDWGLARSLLALRHRIYAATILAFLVHPLDILLVNGYPRQSRTPASTRWSASLAEAMYLLPAVDRPEPLPRGSRRVQDTRDDGRGVPLARGPLRASSACCRSCSPSPAIDLLFGSEFSQAVELYYWLVPGVTRSGW